MAPDAARLNQLDDGLVDFIGHFRGVIIHPLAQGLSRGDGINIERFGEEGIVLATSNGLKVAFA